MEEKWTSLHLASRGGCLQTVISLLKNGAEIEAETEDGRTALLLAADGMEHYSSTIDPRGNKNSLLLLSAEFKYHEITKELIKAGANLTRIDNNRQWTLLHFASRNGWRDIVQSVLKKNINIDAKADNGYTPLLVAAKYRQKNIVEHLLDAGANITCSGYSNHTVLHYASRNGWLEIVEDLLKKGADIRVKFNGVHTALLVAAKNGHRDIVELLIYEGSDVNCSGYANKTVLHYASAFGWLEIVQCLLMKGADIEIETDAGYTPVLIAAYHGHKDIVERLINAGANIKAAGRCNRTLLHHASQNGWLQIVLRLLKKGASIDAKSIDGNTPLQLACDSYQKTIVKHLTRVGADINVESNNGVSPLSTLIRKYPDIELVRLLIESGAHLKSIDYEKILCDSLPSEGILRDVQLCSQSIINKFNHKDLPEFYRLCTSWNTLPRIEKMIIGNTEQVIHETIRSVNQQIQAKGPCNLSEASPISLKMFSVKSFLIYCDNIKITG